MWEKRQFIDDVQIKWRCNGAALTDYLINIDWITGIHILKKVFIEIYIVSMRKNVKKF